MEIISENKEGSFFEKSKSSYFKNSIQKILARADIQINGYRPFDIQVKNEKIFKRLIRYGKIALGESYMDGWWECPEIDQLVKRLAQGAVRQDLTTKLSLFLAYLKATLTDQGSREKAKVGSKHYDFGNDLFKAMLDKRMVYSCANWENSSNLDQAQEEKLERICRALGLEPEMKILDIGCGWGSFVRYAAEKNGVQAIGICLSRKQLELGKELCKGLPIELKYQDYRDLQNNEKFDRIISIEMFEHVGLKNFRNFMKIVHSSLKDDGLFLLRTIARNDTVSNCDHPWIDKYIFPNSHYPSVKQIGEAVEGFFTLENWENFAKDYSKTLAAWYANFLGGWDHLKENYDERFFRMWKFYLLSCKGLFDSGFTQLWQILFSKSKVITK